VWALSAALRPTILAVYWLYTNNTGCLLVI